MKLKKIKCIFDVNMSDTIIYNFIVYTDDNSSFILNTSIDTYRYDFTEADFVLLFNELLSYFPDSKVLTLLFAIECFKNEENYLIPIALDFDHILKIYFPQYVDGINKCRLLL